MEVFKKTIIKLIIFDFDGVLVDSYQFIKNTYQRIGKVLHIKISYLVINVGVGGCYVAQCIKK